MLRQLNQKRSDLDSVGRALLLNWARASAALHEMDAYAEEHGWVKDDGEPRGFVRAYFTALNSERLALRALGEHLCTRDPADDALAALIERGRAIREGGGK